MNLLVAVTPEMIGAECIDSDKDHVGRGRLLGSCESAACKS
jgi:hypothetical protein